MLLIRRRYGPKESVGKKQEMNKLDLYWYEENDNELCGCILQVYGMSLQGYGSICRWICIQIFTAQDGFFIQKNLHSLK
ncbi:hypothetical protein MKC90_21135 [[Clostridium] innocuum]|nr:hypothetical protein [[Clostridium] innocuum]